MSNPIEGIIGKSPEHKKESEIVRGLFQEAEEFKKIEREVQELPLKKEFETWIAAYNLRIRKIQRDANLYLGDTPLEVEENKKKIDTYIIDVPIGAYILYLQKELENIRARYDQLKQEHDQYKQEHDQLKQEHDTFLSEADQEKNPVKAAKLMEVADGKAEKMKEKMKEKMQRTWMIQNEVAARLYPDIERDIRYIETMIGKLPKTYVQDQKTYYEMLSAMQKTMQELRNKTQREGISSEDRISDYFHK